MIETETLEETKRGERGFGSTGKNKSTYAVVLKKEITELTHVKDKGNIHTYEIGKSLTKEQVAQLKGLIKQYSDIFATDFEQFKLKPPKYYHDIDTGDAKPIAQRHYNIPYAYHQWVREEIDKMELNGIVRKSESPWASPVLVVAKKGTGEGKFAPRLCIDYRLLNDVTKRKRFPLPKIGEIFEEITDYRY